MPTHLEELRGEIAALHDVADISPMAAVLAAGSIAENACYTALHLDTETTGESFCSWLRALESQGILDRRTANCMHRLRKSTNLCRHQGERPDLKEAHGLVDDVDHVIDNLLAISIVARCDSCGPEAVPLRIRLNRFFGQQGRVKRAVCPRCKTRVRVHFDELDQVRREGPRA